MNFISKHFNFEELTKTAIKDLQARNRLEALLFLLPLRRLANDSLEPIRVGTGLVMDVNSGFRGRTLNTKIGGAVASQHCLGEAVDFNLRGYDDRESQMQVMKWIVDNNIPFGQLLLERGCIHISSPRASKGQEVAEYDVPTKTKKALDLSGVSLKDFPITT